VSFLSNKILPDFTRIAFLEKRTGPQAHGTAVEIFPNKFFVELWLDSQHRERTSFVSLAFHFVSKGPEKQVSFFSE